MTKKLYSLSEIAKMNLEGLPATAANLRIRAHAEEWYCEERTGLGGVRRVYEIPDRYQTKTASNPTRTMSMLRLPGEIRRSQERLSNAVDTEMLRLATEALEEWLQEKGLGLDPKRKAAVIAVLYDYLAKGADRDDMLRMLKAMAA